MKAYCYLAKDSMGKYQELHCPKCGEKLAYFSGLEHIPDFFYCPKCNDQAYNEDGEEIARLV